MKIIVLANADQQQEILSKQTAAGNELIFIEETAALKDVEDVAAYFLLAPGDLPALDNDLTSKPVFINAVPGTLKQQGLPVNVSRINAWPGFLQREKWEVASSHQGMARDVFNALGWEYVEVADEPGLVAARIIAMIINEAYYALGEGVSTKEEIDVAMKLGTNYPYGPFEWGERIGLPNIGELLDQLSATDPRYIIAPSLREVLAQPQI